MQEILEKQFDADITRTLKFSTLVTPRQQQTARERLLRLAVEQTMLAPLEVEEHVTLRDHAYSLGQHTLRLLNLLIMDSRAYERARRPLRFYEYYSRHGCHDLPFIRVSD